LESLISSPTIDVEITIQCQYLSGRKFIRHANQASVGKINLSITILPHAGLDFASRRTQLKWNLKNARGHILQHRLGSALEPPQQKTTLGYHRLARYQWRLQGPHDLRTRLVMRFAPVQQRDDHSGVQKHGFHFPKSRMCSLFEPRSGTPDRNLPKPITPRFFRR
jgi:hypothetical protein